MKTPWRYVVTTTTSRIFQAYTSSSPTASPHVGANKLYNIPSRAFLGRGVGSTLDSPPKLANQKQQHAMHSVGWLALLEIGRTTRGIPNHPTLVSVHKMKLWQLSNNLIKCTFLNHLQNALQEEVIWNGRQDITHANSTLMGATSFTK